MGLTDRYSQLEGKRRTREDAISATITQQQQGSGGGGKREVKASMAVGSSKISSTRGPYEASSKQNSVATVTSILPTD
jgi:hypothetical protein